METNARKLTFCRNCLAMSTRPRIIFDARGWCNACVWSETKLVLDWDSRQHELTTLLNSHRSLHGTFDCLVPVRSIKFSKYVTYNPK